MSEELKKEWEREFDAMFADNLSIGDEPFNKMYLKLHIIPAIKSFISSLLAKQQEGFVKMIEDRCKYLASKYVGDGLRGSRDALYREAMADLLDDLADIKRKLNDKIK